MIYFELRSKSPLLLTHEDIEKILASALKILDKENDPDRTISIVSLGPKEMRKLNLAARGQDTATDVLSFTFSEKDAFIVAPYVNSFFGEIIICPSMAARKAKTRGISKLEYQRLLLIHGLLHLFNFDHIDKNDADKMEKLEQKILTHNS